MRDSSQTDMYRVEREVGVEVLVADGPEGWDQAVEFARDVVIGALHAVDPSLAEMLADQFDLVLVATGA